MNNDFKTQSIQIQTDKRKINVSQVLLYVIEINKTLEESTGVDLFGASAAGIDSAAAVKIVRSLGLSGHAYIKHTNNKSYLILKGNPGQRAALPGTRYLTSNPSVAHIMISPKSLAQNAVRMTGIAVIAYTGLRVVEALLREEDIRFAQLLGTISSDIIKFSIAAGAGFLAGAAVGAITALAVGPLIAAVFVGVITSVVLAKIDREFGLTEQLVKALEKASDKAMSPFDAVAKAIVQWERGLIQRTINASIPHR